MHSKLSGHMQNGGLGGDQDRQRQQLMDPLQEMAGEIDSLVKLLAISPVQPDIQGWKPRTASPRSPPSASQADRPRMPTPQAQRPQSPGQRLPSPGRPGSPRAAPSPQRDLFNKMDKNKDGGISRAEFNQALAGGGLRP